MQNLGHQVQSRRGSQHGQRMDRAGEFIGQYLIDHALTVNPAKVGERGCHDLDSEMRLSLGPRADVARMKMRFVDYLQG